jgi:hypothetical protein
MKRILTVIGLVIVLTLLVPVSLSCFGKTQVSLGNEFGLSIGDTVEVNGEPLSVKFVDVLADSRCPNYAKCITAGEARCLMEITLNGVTTQVTFTISGGIGSAGEEHFDAYTFDFTLEPYPEIGEDIVHSDYRLVMTIY